MRLCVFIFLISCSASLCAQKNLKVKKDSLRNQLSKDSTFIFRPTFAKPYLRVENQNSFISREQVNLLGFLVGATFVEKHTFALGYYFLDTREKKPISLITNSNGSTNNYVDLNYYLLVYQYVLFNKRYVQLNVPIGLGYGLYDVSVRDSLDQYIGSEKGRILPFLTGVQLILKPVRWAGISGTGGYRFLSDKKNTDLSFKGWYYSFGLWVDARQVIRNVKYYFKKKNYKEELRRLSQS